MSESELPLGDPSATRGADEAADFDLAGFAPGGTDSAADAADELPAGGLVPGELDADASDASDADASVARAQERYDLGPLEWTAVDASGTPAATLARARAALPQLD